MATLIKEQLRNPVDNSWIPLREIEGNENGEVTAIKELDIKGDPLEIESPLAVREGQIVTEDNITALHNLGIHWGFEEAEQYWEALYPNEDERNTMRSNTIYIQINPS